MKRLWDVLVLTLALNFMAVAGAVGWMYQSGRIDRQRVGKIREVLFPPAAPSVAVPEAIAIDPTTRPTLQLDELLAKHASLTAGQQVDFVRQTFETQMAQLDRRTRELADLKAQVDLANAKLASDRTALDADRKALTEEQEQARKLATDQGFQDSLKLYNSMAPRQVKAIFLTAGDDAVLQYLQAMEPRTAAKVIKEFKSPEEIDRIHRIMEQMRQGQPTTREVKE
jgi:hypothetical protein